MIVKIVLHLGSILHYYGLTIVKQLIALIADDSRYFFQKCLKRFDIDEKHVKVANTLLGNQFFK